MKKPNHENGVIDYDSEPQAPKEEPELLEPAGTEPSDSGNRDAGSQGDDQIETIVQVQELKQCKATLERCVGDLEKAINISVAVLNSTRSVMADLEELSTV